MKKHHSYAQLLKKSREQIWKDRQAMDRIDQKIDQRHLQKILKPKFA
ncbi:MAG: FbpB family small basic protein [Sporolactobacillus sp.]